MIANRFCPHTLSTLMRYWEGTDEGWNWRLKFFPEGETHGAGGLLKHRAFLQISRFMWVSLEGRL